jgi:RHS repeat-associated protein
MFALNRLGNTNAQATTFGTMDALTYTYATGNKLSKVEDTSGSLEGFKNGSTATVEYTYDNNGNMITDANKGINGIAYNHLNLPTLVTLAAGNINYVYDATGVKQRKIVSGTTTDYAGGFQYENNVMKFFPHPEGYAENNAGIFSYIYQYKDHLGNVRLSYGDKNNDGMVNNTEIVEENSYYPFGLKHNGYNNTVTSTNPGQKLKYNGKELQDELGLNFYDYGARNYDPSLGRWMNVDPLAEVSRRWSPYSYAYNSPLKFTDPDGMLPEDKVEEKKEEKRSDKSLEREAQEMEAQTKEIKDSFNQYLESTGQEKPKQKKRKVINTTSDARDHYANGKGEPAVIGEESTNELRLSPEYQRVIKKLRNGTAVKINGSFDVNMTYKTFHIGDTNVNYTTTCSGATCTTNFTEFVDDGFWDPDFLSEISGITNPIKRPDGKGPNLELGGTPYDYVSSTNIIIYPNPNIKLKKK